MTNWQFITIIGTFVLAFFGFIVTILGAMRSIQAALSEQLNSFRNEIKAEIANGKNELKAEIETLRNEVRQNDKRYEERFNRIEADIREIKSDLRQALRLALPG
jgi:C4-dicarboxylate-specific signal transduction histidine kinase